MVNVGDNGDITEFLNHCGHLKVFNGGKKGAGLYINHRE
jgi:hypothetical protein